MDNKDNNNKFKILGLGGFNEIGKSMYCIEYNQKIFIFDSGSTNPSKNILGVDTVIPKYDYLINNAHKIVGFFITSPDDYLSNAIPYLEKDLKINVYANQATVNFIEGHSERLYKNKKRNKPNYTIIKEKEIIKLCEGVSIEAFNTTSKFPDSLGYSLKTKDGNIIYVSDMIFDSTIDKGYNANLKHLQKIGSEDNLLFMCGSSNAYNKTYTAPHYKIKHIINRALKQVERRSIIACFEYNLYRLKEICEALVENKISKVLIYGSTLFKVMSYYANQNKYFKGIQFYNYKEAKISDINNMHIIVSGNIDKLYTRIVKIATHTTNIILDRRDKFILAIPPSAGLELNYANILDEIARTHTSYTAIGRKDVIEMKASYEDIKQMCDIFKPKYFLPTNTFYKNFIHANKAAVEVGLNPKHTFCLENGQILELKKDFYNLRLKTKIKVGNKFVDPLISDSKGISVIQERQQMANNGIVVIGANLNSKTKKLISSVDVQLRGVIYLKDAPKTIKNIIDLTTKIIINHSSFKENWDFNNLKQDIRNSIFRYVRKTTGKTPIMLVVINEAQNKF